jgi:hypothetical protein
LAGRGIPLSDAGKMLGAGIAALDGATMGPVLLDDLRLAAHSAQPQVRLLGQFVRERLRRWPAHVDLLDPAVKPEQAVIDLPSLQLVAWVIFRTALFQSASVGAVPGGVALAAYALMPPLRPARQERFQVNCASLPGAGTDAAFWTNWIINKLGGGFQLPGMKEAFPGVVQRLVTRQMAGRGQDAAEKAASLTSQGLAWLNLVTAGMSLLMQVAVLEINPRQVPDPMVRTKTTFRGKDGRLELQLYSAPDKIPNGNDLSACLANFALNALGISLSFPPLGPVPKAEMSVEGGLGFPDLVLFNTEGSNSLRVATGTDGVATYRLFGAPQKRDLPDSAAEVKKEFSVIISAQPEEAGLNSMLNIFFGGLTFGTAPTAPGGLTSFIDILKAFKYDMGEYAFSLTDWRSVGYKVTGWLDTIYNFQGLACSVEKPFNLYGIEGGADPVLWQFDPTGPDGGTLRYDTTYADGSRWYGSGSYTIRDTNGEPGGLTIHTTPHDCNDHGNWTDCGDYALSIILSPVDTPECNKQ